MNLHQLFPIYRPAMAWAQWERPILFSQKELNKLISSEHLQKIFSNIVLTVGVWHPKVDVGRDCLLL